MFMNRIRTPRFVDANPGVQIQTHVASTVAEPSLSITFRKDSLNDMTTPLHVGDNQSLTYKTSCMSFGELVERLSKKCARLEDTL